MWDQFLLSPSVPHETSSEWYLPDFSHLCVNYAFLDTSNSYSGRFIGNSVYISNTTHKENGVLCFRDTIYTRAIIPNLVNITCSYHGGYIIYYNNKTNKPYLYGYTTHAFNELVNCKYLVKHNDDVVDFQVYISTSIHRKREKKRTRERERERERERKVNIRHMNHDIKFSRFLSQSSITNRSQL